MLPARHDDDDISYINLKANLMLAYLLVEKSIIQNFTLYQGIICVSSVLTR